MFIITMDELQSKQLYLRTQILDAAYDPQHFIAFMHQSTQGQTIDISELSFNQLKTLVINYKAQYPPKNQQHQEQIHPPPQQDAKRNKIQYPKYSPLIDYQFKTMINCVETQKLIKVEKLTIEVPDFSTKQTEGFIFGIGSRTQYYYHLKTNIINGVVKRLSEDFDWLNSAINRLFPYLAIPQLETIRKDIEKPYEKRRKDIEEYLQHLSRKQCILTSQLFVDFLTISIDKMEKFKKSYDTMGFAKGASLIKNLAGKVQAELTNNSIQFFKQSKQFTKRIAVIHDKLTQGISKMIQSFQSAIEQTYTVVNYFTQMHEAYLNLSNKYPLQKEEEYAEILVSMNNLFLGIGDSLKGVKEHLEQYGKEYFKYANGFDKNLHRLQKTVKESCSEYLDYKYNLWRKKERVLSDPSKWQLEGRKMDTAKMTKQQIKQAILPRESISQVQMRCWYAFNLKNYQHELKDYLNANSKRYAKVFRVMCKQLLANDKIYLQTLTNFIEESRKY